MKLSAIKLILEMNSVQARDNRPSNASELNRFFEQLGMGNVQLAQLNIGTLIHQTLPSEYQDAARAVASPTPQHNLLAIPDTVDGEFEESPQGGEDLEDDE